MTRRSRAAILVAVLVALVLGGGVAAASWATSGPGNASGKAGALAQPTNVVAAARTCSNGTLSQVWTWTDTTGETGYSVDVASDSAFKNIVVSGNVTAAKATLTQQNYKSTTTYYFRVNGFNNNWTGPDSATNSVSVRSC